LNFLWASFMHKYLKGDINFFILAVWDRSFQPSDTEAPGVLVTTNATHNGIIWLKPSGKLDTYDSKKGNKSF